MLVVPGIVGVVRTIGRPGGAIRGALVVAAAVPIALAGAQVAEASWVLQTPPAPAGVLASALESLSCTSPASCIAVGQAETTSTNVVFAEFWDGTSWSLGRIPGVADASLSDVSCVTPADCTAVGRHDQTLLPLAEHWDGTSWTVQGTSLPPGDTTGLLSGVSCTSATRCVAVGAAGDPSAPFSESWNGTTWTPHTAPLPAGTNSGFSSVSCRSAGPCTAVGDFQVSGGLSPLAESWNGHHWTMQAVPSPSGTTTSSLRAVSCRRAARCMAVGFSSTGGASQPLAEHWNGTSWTIVSTPHLGGAKAIANFQGVSCPLATWCTATGSVDLRSKGKTVPVAEHWNGTRWTVDAVVEPARSRLSILGAVACLARSSCIAVGSYETPRGKERPLAEQES